MITKKQMKTIDEVVKQEVINFRDALAQAISSTVEGLPTVEKLAEACTYGMLTAVQILEGKRG
jgi:hypothetical protein